MGSRPGIISDEVTPETAAQKQVIPQENISFAARLKNVFTNKFYWLLVIIYLLLYTNTGVSSSISVYYFNHILGDAKLMGATSMASFVMIIGLMLNPALVKKFGMYRVNLVSYIITSVLSIGLFIFSFSASFMGIVVVTFLRSISSAFLMGSINALVAEVAKNNWLKTNLHSEGTMFSCSSIGMKIGGGIGTAGAGWILSLTGYVGTATVQTEAVKNGIKFAFGGIPLILAVLITICLYFMNVEKDNRKLEKNRGL